jgi:hypothetical protein
MSRPLLPNLTLIRDAAPVFRRACPESLDAPISLPAKLVHPEFSLRHFPAMDILFSVCTFRPMLFRYDVSYTPELCEGVLDVDNIGLQWMHGIPDQFILMLARMNMLRDDFGSNTDCSVIHELETEIRDFRPILGVSTDPLLTVARLAVQESWRQAMYIYLYMVSLVKLLVVVCTHITQGLCNANAADIRVEKAIKGFIRLLEGTKPGRTPDAFLMIPMIIVSPPYS